MFKTDKRTLERLSFSFNERDIANFRATLEHLKSEELLTIPKDEIETALKGLEKIGKLKLDGKVYAFHVIDEYAFDQSGNGEGVELYLRQGDLLHEFYVSSTRDAVPGASDAAEFLNKEKISTICTGNIPLDENFLGIPQSCDEDDPIIRSGLEDYEIREFENAKIEVVKLDYLI